MDLPLKLVCDESQIGLDVVLSHVMKNGTEKLIAYAKMDYWARQREITQVALWTLEIPQVLLWQRTFHIGYWLVTG